MGGNQIAQIGRKEEKMISCGTHHCFVLDCDGVWSWGYNRFGQLGRDRTELSQPFGKVSIPGQIIGIYGGASSSIAVDIHGDVYSFGSNNRGESGFPISTSPNPIPRRIDSLQQIQTCSVGGNQFFTALDMNGDVWVCGSNEYGQIGLGEGVNSVDSPQRIPQLENIIQIAAGLNFTLALNVEGVMFSFGSNSYGQLGLGDISGNRFVPTRNETVPHQISKLFTGCGCHCFIKDIKGDLWAFGRNSFFQLGFADNTHRYQPTLLENPLLRSHTRAVACGGYHTLIIDDIRGVLWGFGLNRSKQIDKELGGLVSVPEQLKYFKDVAQISAGTENSLIADQHGRVWALGDNSYCQLGQSHSFAVAEILHTFDFTFPTSVSRKSAAMDWSNQPTPE